jgi:hypothetical protein
MSVRSFAHHDHSSVGYHDQFNRITRRAGPHHLSRQPVNLVEGARSLMTVD